MKPSPVASCAPFSPGVATFRACNHQPGGPFEDLNDFGYVVEVKENAPELLRKAPRRLHGEGRQRVWAYSKAPWSIEDTVQDLGLIYRAMGWKGLESIESQT